MDRSAAAGESKWNSKRRRLILRVFNSTSDGHYGGTLDAAAGLSNADDDDGGRLRCGAPSGSDSNGRQSETFIGRSPPVDQEGELTQQPTTAAATTTTTTTATSGDKKPQKSASPNARIDSDVWRSDRRRNDDILNESCLPRLNSGNRGDNNRPSKVSSKSYNLPTERDDQVGLIRSNSDFRKGRLKRTALPDKYWSAGRILGYLDNVELLSMPNNEANETDADRKKVTGLQFDPLCLPRLNVLDLGRRGVAIALDEGQPSYYYVPDRFRSRDRSRDRVTMDSFPTTTPEDLKFLSAKHFLRKLRREKQEAGPRRKYGGDPEDGGTGVPEVDSKARDDRLDTASTGSTASTATVYLMRTVKKSSLGPNGGGGGDHHGNGKANDLDHSMPYKRRHAGNRRSREIVLEPVQIVRNGDDRRKIVEGQAREDTGGGGQAKEDTGEGQAKDTAGEGQQLSRTTKTKRVKDSTAQTNDLDSAEGDAEVSAAAVPLAKVIVPRRPKRTIGLQTVVQAELLFDDDATLTSSSPRDPCNRRSIGVQTTTTRPIDSKTSTGTQTTGGDDVTRRHQMKRTRDVGAQTETDSNPLPEVEEEEEAEETVTSLERRHKRTWSVPDVPVDRPKANDATKITKIVDLPQDSPEQAIILTEGQDMTFYSLQHEVRLLRHENYFLRQQLDYPIKPKGKLQKQNEAKILQIIRHLESNGSKGKMTPQIRDEMIKETMIENEILRAENSYLQATLDQSRRLQEQLSSENDVLKTELDLLLERPADHRFMPPTASPNIRMQRNGDFQA